MTASEPRPARDVSATHWFWALFVAAIVLAALFEVYLHLAHRPVAVATPTEPRIARDEQGRVAVSERFLHDLERAFPGLVIDLKSGLAAACTKVDGDAANAIDGLFAPVLQRVPDFLDFHYSVTGEYTELIAAASQDAGRAMQRILFDETAFTRREAEALAQIAQDTDQAFAQAIDRVRNRIRQTLQLDAKETATLTDIVDLTIDDARARFGTGELLLKGGAGGVAAAAALTKTLGAKTTAKLTAKAAGKTAAKAVGGGSAAVGATAGLACGPLAWLCAPVAGMAAGLAAWLLTDKAVVEADEYFNRDQFDLKLRQELGNMRTAMRSRINTACLQRAQALTDQTTLKLEGLSTKALIERTAR